MHINPETGLIDEAEYIASPNCDVRPTNVAINLLIIHNISLPPGKFGGPYISQLFTNQLNPDEHPFFLEIKDLRVSSHLLIQRNGDIIQYVPLDKRAWHAGISEFDGKPQCNDYSIGIELEGTDDLPYEAIQYQQLAAVTQSIMQRHPAISLDKICGHCHIAPGRKTDPGAAFDWEHYKALLCESR